MTLTEQIKADLVAAMKARQPQVLDVLRMLSTSMKNKAIDLKHELDDAEVIAVLKSDLKKLQDALADFTTAARKDLIAKTQEEIAIIKKYLPPEMSAEELEEKVRAKLAELGIKEPKDIGKAIGAVMADLKGLADGARVKALIEKILG
jgi:uncharacterized protein YqeY